MAFSFKLPVLFITIVSMETCLCAMHIDTGLVNGIRNVIHIEKMALPGLCLTDIRLVNIDPTTQICCNGVLNKVSRLDECCSGKIIDATESFCCNGQIVTRSRSQRLVCSGEDVYNQQEQSKNVRSFSQGYYFCGSEVIHSSTHFCFENIVYERHENQKLHSTESENDSTNTKEINQLPDENDINVSSNIITILCCLTVVCVPVAIFVYCKTRPTKAQSVNVHRTVLPEPHSGLTLQWHSQTTSFQPNNPISDTTLFIPDVAEIPTGHYVKDSGHPGDKFGGASNFHKSLGTSNKNVGTSTTCTQTYPEKACNFRNIFGNPFEYNFILSSMSGATAKMPNSEVRLILPQTFLKQKRVEVNCTSFRSLFKLREKLGLSEEEGIASPVVEYALHGVEHLPDYAAVIMPFTGSAADLQVRKFHSDGGVSSVVMSVDVPLQGDSNQDLDTSYTVEDSNVRIFSKSVAGFYCTTCRHRPLRLRCLLFGSYKRFTNPIRHEVCAVVYLANDDVMKFEDYKETQTAKETAEGRVLKEERELTIPDDLTEDDIIQTSVTPIDVHYTQWIHDHCLEEATPVHEKIQTISLGRLADRCKDCQHYHPCIFDTPFRMEWFLKKS